MRTFLGGGGSNNETNKQKKSQGFFSLLTVVGSQTPCAQAEFREQGCVKRTQSAATTAGQGMETVSRRPTVSRDVKIEKRVEAGRGKRGTAKQRQPPHPIPRPRGGSQNWLCSWTTGVRARSTVLCPLQQMKPSMLFPLKFGLS